MSEPSPLPRRLRRCADDTLRNVDRDTMLEAADAIEALVVERDNVIAQRDLAERTLSDLLAVIHRDGGHYQAEHGGLKAAADAHLVWAALMGRAERAEAERDEARALLREARAFVAMWHERSDLLARIDALLSDKEGTT